MATVAGDLSSTKSLDVFDFVPGKKLGVQSRFGEAIRTKARRWGKSRVYAIANEAGLTQRDLSGIIAGNDSEITGNVAERASEVLDIDIDDCLAFRSLNKNEIEAWSQYAVAKGFLAVAACDAKILPKETVHVFMIHCAFHSL